MKKLILLLLSLTMCLFVGGCQSNSEAEQTNVENTAPSGDVGTPHVREEAPEGAMPPMDGEMPEGAMPPMDGEMPEGAMPPAGNNQNQQPRG